MNAPTTRLWRRYVLPATFAALLLVLLVARVEPAALLEAMRRVRPLGLAGAAALVIMARYGFQLDRWGRILSALGCRLSMRELLRIGAASWTLQLGTPGKLGAVLVAASFERSGRLDAPRTLSSLVLPSVHTLIVFALLAPLGLGLWQGKSSATAPGTAGFLSPLGLAALAGALVIALVALTWACFTHFSPRRGLWAWVRGLATVFTGISARTQVALFLYSAACVLLEVAAVGVLLHACGVAPPVLTLAGGVCLVMLVANLPISLGGLGTREAATVVLFAAWGEPGALLATGLLWSALFYLLPIVIGLPWVPGLMAEVLSERGGPFLAQDAIP